MGSPDCEWGRGLRNEQESVTTLTHDFWMKETEVTQDEWTALGVAHRSGVSGEVGDCIGQECPVGNVTWSEAVAYANAVSGSQGLAPCYRLDQCTGALGEGMMCGLVESLGTSVYACDGYRIPTEAEWEYATRAGTRTAFYGGHNTPSRSISDCSDDPSLTPIAWYCGSTTGGRTLPVKGKAPNAYGLSAFPSPQSATASGSGALSGGPSFAPSRAPSLAPSARPSASRLASDGIWGGLSMLERSEVQIREPSR